MKQVPVGTVFKNQFGHIVCDLYEDQMMFLAARAGAGGKGNHFFASDLQPEPRMAELGAEGENFVYTIELSSMAHFGLVSICISIPCWNDDEENHLVIV